MPRAISGATRHKKTKKILKNAGGYSGGRHRLYRTAKEATQRAGYHAFIGRKQKKRDFRSLWITRITAATRERGVSYSRFIHGLKLARVDLDRKALSEIAIHDPATFDRLIEMAAAQK